MKGQLKETLRITVTQEDWDKATEAVKNNMRHKACPVSQAICREFPGFDAYTRPTASITCEGSMAEYALGVGEAIVSAFDLKHPITLPVTFSLSRLA